MCEYCVDLLRVPWAVLPSGLPTATPHSAVVQFVGGERTGELLDCRAPADWQLTSAAAVAARLAGTLPGQHGPGRGTLLFHRMPG